jgi:hypothetical protein
MADERALLMAIPLRHLRSSAEASTTGPAVTSILPAGGPGDADAASPGMQLMVIATDAGDAEVPAATWRATFVRRVPYEVGSPWPDGLPPTWGAEHPVPEPVETVLPAGDDALEDDDLDDEEDDEDEVGPQSFLEVSGLIELARADWVFTNELVRKQARGGRTYRPRVPTLVDLPD